MCCVDGCRHFVSVTGMVCSFDAILLMPFCFLFFVVLGLVCSFEEPEGAS
uniref:Uncharacterized protein n=1 Tax=Arundo donax TaxID=35708 RepID=A0A0A8Z4S7_ARUDO